MNNCVAILIRSLVVTILCLNGAFALSALTKVGAFRKKRVFERILPSLSPKSAYDRVLKGWRDDNLGFPPFVPYPLILNRGNEATGVGLVLQRVPLFLREGIVAYEINSVTGSWTMNYQILNPSYFTFPVKAHRGTIVLSPMDAGSSLKWTVEWTPLPPARVLDVVTELCVGFAINRAADYVVEGDPEAKGTA